MTRWYSLSHIDNDEAQIIALCSLHFAGYTPPDGCALFKIESAAQSSCVMCVSARRWNERKATVREERR